MRAALYDAEGTSTSTRFAAAAAGSVAVEAVDVYRRTPAAWPAAGEGLRRIGRAADARRSPDAVPKRGQSFPRWKRAGGVVAFAGERPAGVGRGGARPTVRAVGYATVRSQLLARECLDGGVADAP